jgi:hypothetical protein
VALHAQQVYFDRARELGDVAWKILRPKRAPAREPEIRPLRNAHRCDTLALALLELHLDVLHITAVRCPSNTIDR